MVVKDAPEFFYTFWGAIKAGIVPVPLNTLLRAKDYTFMIDDSEAAGVIYSPEFWSEIAPALQAAQHRPQIVLATEGDGETIAKYMSKASPDLFPAPATPEDDCIWLYSSGPLLVCISQSVDIKSAIITNRKFFRCLYHHPIILWHKSNSERPHRHFELF
mgnify:CR=1 FL=1